MKLGAFELPAAHCGSPPRKNHRDCRSSYQTMDKAAKTLPWTWKPITAVLNYKVSRSQDSVGAVGGQLKEARGEESGPATCR
jgi:hypothetical protein